jgi:hypothetical protein
MWQEAALEAVTAMVVTAVEAVIWAEETAAGEASRAEQLALLIR